MGIIILLTLLLALGIMLTIIGYKYWDWDVLGFVMIVLCSIIGIAIIATSIVCFITQVGKETTIYSLEQQRESLVENYNTYYNNYDKDIVHSQSLKEIRQEIAEFNATINKNNNFSHNFFVNWFYVNCESIQPIMINNGVAE